MEAGVYAWHDGLQVCDVWKICAMQWDFSTLHYLDHPKSSVVTPMESSTVRPRSNRGVSNCGLVITY